MIAAGVDYNDFVRVTTALESWEDWLDAWAAVGDGHRERAEGELAAGHRRSAGEAFLLAAVSYHFAKFVWVLDAERNRATTLAARDALARAHALLDPTAERVEARLAGATLAANLRRPPRAARPPLVLLVPGLDSTKEEFFSLERFFLERGMATLAIDGPGQGEGGFELTIRPDYEVAVAAFLDALGGRGDLDLGRVGAVGLSLGGYYAPRAAAFEPRITAVAGVSGPYDMSAHWDQLPGLTRETLRHHTGSRTDAEARARAAELSLAGVATRIEQPALIVAGRRDRLIPWQDTHRIATEAPGAEWVLYDEGTHVCNNLACRYRPLVADWMAARLGAVELRRPRCPRPAA